MAETMLTEDVVCKAARSLGLRMKKVHRRISVEEFNERWSNFSLCMFCGEQETPYHHLQHKNEVIRLIGRDDDQTFDDKEETHQVHETLTNPAPIEEDVSSNQICDEKELVSIDLDQQEVQTKAVAEEKLNLPKGQNIEHLVGKNLETFSTDYSSFLNPSSSNGYQKDSTWIESSLYLLCSLKDGRVWEPGGLPNKINGKPKEESKPHQKKSHQTETFEVLSSLEPSRRSHNEQLGVSDDSSFAIVRTHISQSQSDLKCVPGNAHRMFDVMSLETKPLKNKRKYALQKTWWFKFKTSLERSKLIDYKLSFTEELGAQQGFSIECVDEKSFGVDKIKEWLFKVEEFFSIYVTPRELKVKLALNHFDGDAANWHQMLVMPQIAINANLGFSEYNIKDESMKVMIPGNHMRMLRQLHKSRVQCKMKMQKMDLFSFGTHAEMEGNVKLKQLLAAMERFSQEVIEQNIEGQLQDVRKGEAESFPCLNFAANQPLLWMQNTCEPILIVSELERMKKKLGYKTWMFKYKAPLRRVQFLHYYDKEVPIATNCAVQRIWDKDSPEVDITGAYSVLYNVFEMVKELLLKTSLVNPQVMRNTKLKFSKRWMFKYKDVKESIQRLQILLRYKNRSELKGYVSADRESEGNQPTLRLSAWVREILLNHYMVRLLTLVAYAIHFLGGVGKDKKQSHLSLWINRVWDPGRSLVKDASYSTRMFSSLPTTIHVSLLCQESLANQITSFSPNLEVKVSLKGEDVIQDKRREKSGTCEFARESS